MAADKSKQTRLASKSDTDKEPCIFCNEIIDLNKKGIRCDICANWVCFACSNLSKYMYTEISKASEAEVEWKCKICKTTKSDLKSIRDTLKELIRSNDDRLNTMESKLTNLEANLKESVEESRKMKESVRNDLAGDISQVRTDIAGDISKMRSEISDELDKRLKEREDIAKRERNLFIYNVPESTEEEFLDRIEEDRSFVMKVCDELGAKDAKFTAIIRFGKVARNPDNSIDISKSRPIRVTFLEKRVRRLVLVNAKLLKSPKDSSLKNISISRDMTDEEKKQYKKLELELKERRKIGEDDIYISRGKIVKRTTADKPEASGGEPEASGGGPDTCFP